MSFLHNYFDGSTKLNQFQILFSDLYLSKFLDTSANHSFCV